MTEYTEEVTKQKLLLEAEAWAKEIKQVHTFNSNSTNMAYNYPNPDRDGYVTDTTFNDGTVERVIHSSGQKKYFGTKPNNDTLLHIFKRSKK